MDEVQQLADGLAETLGRSVEIDDPDLLPLAITEQFGELDDVRVRAILARRSAAEVRAYAFSLDIANATAPVRYPANPTLGTLPRVCVPLRSRDQLHGYLWLIDSPKLAEQELAAAQHTADQITAILQRRRQTETATLDHETALVSSLLDPRASITDDLLDGVEILRFTEPLTVVTVLLNSANVDEHLGLPDLRFVAGAVSPFRSPGSTLLGYGPDSIRLIVLQANVTEDRMRPFLRGAARAARRFGWDVAGAGVGSPSQDIESLRLAGRRSSFAAQIAQARGVSDLSWSGLGCDAAFFDLPWTAATVELLSPGLIPLLADENRPLRETVDAILEYGADTQAAAKALSIHRTTLYYRLGRVGDLLGEDWSRGTRRLGLQLALRLAWLMRNTATPTIRR